MQSLAFSIFREEKQGIFSFQHTFLNLPNSFARRLDIIYARDPGYVMKNAIWYQLLFCTLSAPMWLKGWKVHTVHAAVSVPACTRRLPLHQSSKACDRGRFNDKWQGHTWLGGRCGIISIILISASVACVKLAVQYFAVSRWSKPLGCKETSSLLLLKKYTVTATLCLHPILICTSSPLED